MGSKICLADQADFADEIIMKFSRVLLRVTRKEYKKQTLFPRERRALLNKLIE